MDETARRPVHNFQRSLNRRIATGIAVAVGLGVGSAAPAKPESLHPTIVPLTQIGPNLSGYLADPQPIHLAPGADHRVQYISGTTAAVIAGNYPLQPESFAWTPITVNADALQGQIAAGGAKFLTIQNTNLFQDDQGNWHALVGVDVRRPGNSRLWTVIAHAHPSEPSQGGAPPRAWAADTVLVGSFNNQVQGNYDPKYYTEDGRLYLLYVRNYVPQPALRNEIVIQPMASPTQTQGPASVLLTPGDRYGELNSEWYANTKAKLVEAPSLTRINGKYALVYSTGAYLTPSYKAAVAWSDTLIPSGPDARYRKVLMPDPRNVWENGGKPEVRYLLQSQKPAWPNFTAGTVIGPGVAAAVQGPGGAYWLYFNGFHPGDMPKRPDGQVDGKHRRPYALRLQVDVPADQSVHGASDAELTGWLRPAS